MPKNNNRLKKEEPKQPDLVQAVEGNTGTLTIALLNQILQELKEINGRLE
jgi:hypothetical protein